MTFHVRLIDVNEGAIHAPTISWHDRRASIVLITSLVRKGITCPTWTLTTHVQQFFRCNYPCKLLSLKMSVGSRSGKLRLRGGPCHPPVTIVRRCRLCPATQVHRLFHIQPLRLPPYQNNCREVAPSWEAPTFIETLSARMVAGRNCPPLQGSQNDVLYRC